jgi:hypothetical protein
MDLKVAPLSSLHGINIDIMTYQLLKYDGVVFKKSHFERKWQVHQHQQMQDT